MGRPRPLIRLFIISFYRIDGVKAIGCRDGLQCQQPLMHECLVVLLLLLFCRASKNVGVRVDY